MSKRNTGSETKNVTDFCSKNDMIFLLSLVAADISGSMNSLTEPKADALSACLGPAEGEVVKSVVAVVEESRKPRVDELSIAPTRDLVPERHDCTMCSNNAENVWIDLPFAKLKSAHIK
jgi:hypothetical protein